MERPKGSGVALALAVAALVLVLVGAYVGVYWWDYPAPASRA